MKRKLLSFITSALLMLSLLSVLPVSSAAAQPAQVTVQAADDGRLVFESEFGKVTAIGDNTTEEADLRLRLRINDADNDQISFVRRCSDDYAYKALANESKTQAKQKFYTDMYNAFCEYWLCNFDNTGKYWTDTSTRQKYVIIGTLKYSDYGLTLDDAINTYAMLRHDVPAFYFLAANLTYNAWLQYITIISDSTLETASARMNVQSKISTYLSNYVSTVDYKYSDYYKAVSLNNYLCNNCEYWYDNGQPSDNEYAHSVAGPILYKKGVCEAYAKLYQMILNYIGLDNIYVIGTSRNNGGHAWNLVSLNGKYYNMDTTWNDMSGNDYVLRGTTNFYRDHTPFKPTDDYFHHLYALPTISSSDYSGSRDQYRPESASYTKQLSNLRTTKVTLSEASFQWDIPETADGVYVYLQNSSTGSFTQLAKLTHYTDTFTKSGLRDSTTYKFMFRTYHTYNGKEYLSDTPNYITATTASFTKQLTNLKASAVTYSQVSLQWDIPENADGVYVYLQDASTGNFTQQAKLAKKTNTFTKTGLTAETAHKFMFKTYITSGGKELVSNTPSYITVKTASLPAGSASVTRFSGSNRYETAVKISQGTFVSSAKSVIIASGESYYDALAGVPLASAMGAPILLTKKQALDSTTLAEIKRLGAKSAVILGGSGAVSADIETTLKNNGLTVERIKGSGRADTAVKIAQKMAAVTKGEINEAFFVSSGNYPDALSVSSIAALKKAPILYLDKTGVPDTSTASLLSSLKKNNQLMSTYIIGGTSAISSAAETNIKNYCPFVTRVHGSNRYDTCIKVNTLFAAFLTGKSVCLATGTNFPDALAGGVLAAKEAAPVILTVGNTLTADQQKTIGGRSFTKVYVFGGKNAVSNDVAYAAAILAA